MSDSSNAAPAAPVTPAPAAPAAGEDWKAMNAEQFKAFREEQRSAGEKAALKALGVKTAEEAKLLLETAKKLEDAQKSELQKATERAAALEVRAQRADVYEKTIGTYAAQEFEALSGEAKKLVELQAGDDPHARLQVIANLRAAGLVGGAAPKVPAPATTVGPSGPRAVAPTLPASNAYEQWQAIKARSELSAAQYYQMNRTAIEAARPKDTNP